MLNLGARLHDFNKRDLEGLAKIAREKEFTGIQLALAKALPEMNSSTGSLNPGMARYISKTFDKNDIQIAVLGCYVNIVHPDEKVRESNIRRFKEHLRFAKDFNAPLVGTETFSLTGNGGHHIDDHTDVGYNEALNSVAQLVEEAEKFGAIVGIEPVAKHVINTSKRMRRLLDDIKSNNLQVIFDPTNLLTMDNYKKQEDVFKEAMELFGDRIVTMHAKDFQIIDGDVRTVPVGTGLLNYDEIFKLIKPAKPFLNILLEDTKEPFMDHAREYLRDKFNNV